MTKRPEHFILISPTVCLSSVTRSSSFCLYVPNKWGYRDTFCYYCDGYIEKAKVLLTSNNRGYIPVGSFYGDTSNYKDFKLNYYGNYDVLVRLIESKP